MPANQQQSWRPEAENALRQKNWKEAERLLRPVVKANPTDGQAWVFLAESLEHQGEPIAAWQCYNRAWILDPMAAWAPAASQRLKLAKSGAFPKWLEKLLAVPRVRVVGAILAKNESEHITDCIRALKPAVDTVIVVDTGSTDNTIALAEAEGAQIVRTAWQEDFGAARNAANALMGDDGWVLWVDADEFLEADDVDVPRIVAGLWNSSDAPILLRIGQVNHFGQKREINYDMTRMYPLGHTLRWEGRVHEQVVADKADMPFRRGSGRIRVHHWGYEPETMKRLGKYERNIRLLTQWTQDDPENPAIWGFLGRDLLSNGRVEEAVPALTTAERLAAKTPNYARLPEVRAALCDALVRTKHFVEAYSVAQRATQDAPDHPVGWYWLAHTSLILADQHAKIAISASQKVQEVAPKYRGLVAFNADVPQFFAPLTLADALKMSGRWDEALTLYQQLVLNPDHAPVVHAQIDGMVKRAQLVLKKIPVTTVVAQPATKHQSPGLKN